MRSRLMTFVLLGFVLTGNLAAGAGTTVLNFSEFKTDTRQDWNASNYADYMPNTPAIVSEVLTPKGGLDVRLNIPNEQADFKYPVCMLIPQSYPQAASADLRVNPYTQYFRFAVDKSVDAEALVLIESFELLSNPGTKQAPGVKLWITDSKREVVWGPVIVSPYSAQKGRIWPQEIPPTVKADTETTLWIQDLDSFNIVNIKDGYWAIDNLRFCQLTKAEQAERRGYELTNVGREDQRKVERGALNPARVEVAYFPSKQQVVVAFSAIELADRLDQLRAEFTIASNKTGQTVASGAIDKFNETIMAGVLDIKNARPGKYSVRARLLQGEKLLDEHIEQLEVKPLPVWWDNKIGILPDDKVPPPWTNLVVKSDKASGISDISCWNRIYRYRKSLLPVQVETTGVEILNRPIQLKGTINGKSCSTAPGRVKFVKKTNSRVEFTTTGSLGDLPLRTETWMEFDGLMWVKLHLEPKGTVNVSDLRLEIPVKREYATLYNSDREDDRKGIGELEDSFFTRFDPIWNRATQCWLGDEYRGIHWCAESDRNWQLNDPHKGIGYIRHPEQVVVTINFIDHDVKITEPMTLEFGLMATPTKPKPKGWRSWRFGYGHDPGTLGKSKRTDAGAGATAYGPNDTNYEVGFSYWSKFLRTRYPLANSEAPGRIKHLLKQGIKVVPDCTIVWCNPIGPEYSYFQDEWHPAHWALPDVEKMNADKNWLEYAACPGCKSYADWKVWALTKLVKRLNLHGIYFDMSMPTLCGSHWHDCGFQDENRGWPPVNGYFPDGYGPCLPYRRLIDQIGHYHPETQILATRELFKRFYITAKQHDPNFMIVYHTSGDYYMSINSFCTAIYLGEDLRRPPTNYYHKLKIDTFRAGYMGHNLGPLSLFLPEFTSSAARAKEDVNFWRTPAAEKQVRQLIGMLLVHDCDAMPSGSTLHPYDEVRAAQNEFGQWDDAMEFLPYWNNSNYVLINPKDKNLVCSVFRGKPKNPDAKSRVMLVVFNNTDKDVQTKVGLSFKNLKVSGTQLRDLRTGEVFKIQGNVSSVNMPYRDFRMLLLE